MAKFTWDMVFEDFKNHHPTLSASVIYWCPVDLCKIRLYFDDGKKGVYDCDIHKLTYIQGSWKKEA